MKFLRYALTSANSSNSEATKIVYFVDSSSIIVFPSAERNYTGIPTARDTTVPTIETAKYSQLLTEYNFTHSKGLAGSFDNYIIKNNSNGFIASFNGYLIYLNGELTSIPEGSQSSTVTKLGLVCATKGDNIDNTFKFNNILRPINNLSALDMRGKDLNDDAAGDADYYFTGLAFLVNAESEGAFTHIFNLAEDTSAIARYNSRLSQLQLS